jgi:KDO2-lipid IV(A) lauroyltransferase
MRAPITRSLRTRTEATALRAAVAAARVLPHPLALAGGAALGRFAFSIVRARRSLVLRNLASSQLARDLDPGRRLRIARHVYENFGRSLVEYARLPVTGRREIERRVRREGLERLDAVLARGRGVVVVSGHFGSWQLLGGTLARLGYRVNYLAIRQHNPQVNRVQEEIGDALGIRLLQPGMGSREMFRALERNEIVVILADQHAGPGGVTVDFLGRPASTARGPAEAAIRTGAPILPMFIVREEGGEHRLLVGETIEPRGGGDAAGAAEREREIARLTRLHVDALASVVKRHPEQWWWLHRRWRGGMNGDGRGTGSAAPVASRETASR